MEARLSALFSLCIVSVVASMLLLQLLHVVEAFVVAVAGDEFVVLAAFYYFAFVEDVYDVCVLDGGESMCDGYGCSALHEAVECFLYEVFAFCVECGCCFVEDEYGWVFEDGSCYADALPLSAGESASSVADDGVVSVFGFHDEVVCVGYFCCFYDLFHGGVFYAEGDVVVEGVVEEDGFLVDVSDE